MSPQEVGRCSLWQLDVAVAGWVATHGAQDKRGELTPEDEDALWEAVLERS